MNLVELVLRIGLTAVFLLSAAGKTMSFPRFEETTAQVLGLRRHSMVGALAGALIAAEVLAAGLVATADGPDRASVAAAVGLLLSALFTVAALRAAASGAKIACNCYGGLRPVEMLGLRTLRRTLPLAAAIGGWRVAMGQISLDSTEVTDRAAVSVVAAALIASVLAWSAWRRGIPHRRFAERMIHLQLTQSVLARSRGIS